MVLQVRKSSVGLAGVMTEFYKLMEARKWK